MRRKKPKQIEYYMHHEIFQQIEVLSSLFEEHVDYEKRQIRFSEKSMIGKLKKIKRYVFLGLGSSAHAAMMGNYYFEEIAMINAEFEFADEFVSRRAILEPHTAVVVLSQSGKSKDAISAAKIAKDKGAVLISVSNTQGSALDRLADLRFNTNAGEEKGVAATKSFSSQLMILFLLSLYILQMKNEKLVLRRKWIDELRKTPEYLKEVLGLENEIKKIAKAIYKKDALMVLGRKFNFPIALEGAHKIKETAYFHAEGVASEEFRHGHEAMLDKDFPVFVLSSDIDFYKDDLKLFGELQKAKAPLFVLSDYNKAVVKNKSKAFVKFKKTNEITESFQFLVLLQLLAFHLAILKEIDVNNPRNISKYVDH